MEEIGTRSITSLPIEILILILENLPNTKCLENAAMSCHRLYSAFQNGRDGLVLRTLSAELKNTLKAAIVLHRAQRLAQSMQKVDTAAINLFITSLSTENLLDYNYKLPTKDLYKLGNISGDTRFQVNDVETEKRNFSKRLMSNHKTVKYFAIQYCKKNAKSRTKSLEKLAQKANRLDLYEAVYLNWITTLIYPYMEPDGRKMAKRMDIHFTDFLKCLDELQCNNFILNLYSVQHLMEPYLELLLQIECEDGPGPHWSIRSVPHTHFINQKEFLCRLFCNIDFSKIPILIEGPKSMDTLEKVMPFPYDHFIFHSNNASWDYSNDLGCICNRHLDTYYPELSSHMGYHEETQSILKKEDTFTKVKTRVANARQLTMKEIEMEFS